MVIYKGKSFYPNKISDEQIKELRTGVRKFISFEGAITLFRQYYNQMGIEHQPSGYRVTEQGIELIYDQHG